MSTIKAIDNTSFSDNNNSANKAVNINNDRKVAISIGKNRKDKKWENTEIFFSDLIEKIRKPIILFVNREQYASLSKAEQDDLKDVGGFVGGTFQGNRRTANNLERRYLITLDADYATADFCALVTAKISNCCLIHSTISHCPEKPRFRLVIPIEREVTADEYQAIARKIASIVL